MLCFSLSRLYLLLRERGGLCIRIVKLYFNVHVKKSLLDQDLIDGAMEKCFDDNSFLKDFIFFCSVQMYRISNLALEKKPAPFINTLARLVYNLFGI